MHNVPRMVYFVSDKIYCKRNWYAYDNGMERHFFQSSIPLSESPESTNSTAMDARF